MGAVIEFLLWLMAFLIRIGPFFVRAGLILSSIWGFLKVILGHPATWLLLSFYPIISFFIEMFTGHKGMLSGVISDMLSGVVNIVLKYTFHTNLQDMINQIPGNVLQIACYMGVTGSLQLIFDGFVSAMTILLAMEFALVGWKIKKWILYQAWHMGFSKYPFK